MNLYEIEVGRLYWLVEGTQLIVQVVVMSIDEELETLRVRLPNGAIQEVYPDEIGPI